jgi:3-oxosteroid 1-dehydrogenase
MGRFDQVADVLIVGSGAGALVASLVVKEQGLHPLVVESTGNVGGSSALSGGGLWVPGNALMHEAGIPDSFDEALAYMEDAIGDAGPASSRERKEAFLREGPAMIDYLRMLGMRFVYGRGYPDYYPDRPGASVVGRGVEGAIFNGRQLGPWLSKLRMDTVMPPLPIYTAEVSQFALAARTPRGMLTAAKVVGARAVGRRLLGQVPLTNGKSLVGQLLLLNLRRSVPIWLDSPMRELIIEDGAVTGAVVEHDGKRVRIGARRGVLLAAGGFAHNARMRRECGPHPTSTEWTSASPGDLGDAIRAGQAAGAATALLDDAWWGPTILGPAGKPFFALWERSFPGSIIVDSAGHRFMNESTSYVDAGHAMYERNKKVPAIPAVLIFDSRFRRRYPLATLLPGLTPRSALREGWLKKATTLEDLARQTGVDPAGLASSVERFNRLARNGRDDDFHRGDTAYDRLYGDPSVRPSPNLGPIDAPPYYATAIYPGDLGTKGGLLTDAHARVLRDDGIPIPGLYAAGNTTASVMGRTYLGPGSTLSPATTFAYIAARHITRESALTNTPVPRIEEARPR